MKKLFDKNLVIIFCLGISSGLPISLILSTLKAVMVDAAYDLKTIGFFSLVSLPYSLKIFFAPIIDSFALPVLTKRFGQRRSWIIFSQILLITFIVALGNSAMFGSLTVIALFAFLVAFASASQDIVIDAYRIEIVAKENQGLAAGFYIYGYRIGMLLSGALALVMAEYMSWNAVYSLVALFMFIGVLAVIFGSESRPEWQAKNYNFLSWLQNAVIAPLLDFSKNSQWFIILTFIVLFKLADAFAGNLTLPFLLNLGYSKIEIATIVKSFGLFATLFGVFCGGILVKKLSINQSLWIASVAQMLSNFAFCYLAKIGYNKDVLYLVIFVENFSGGIGDAIFVAYLSSLCNIAFSATQYAILASLATLARSVLSSSAGVFAEAMGWYNFFVLSALLAVPALILLTLLTNKRKY